MSGQSRPGAAGVDTRPPYDGASGAVLPRRHLLEGHPQFLVRLVLQHAVHVLNIIDGDVPYFGRPLHHLGLDVQGGLIAGPPGLEGYPAPAGVRSEADCVSIRNLGFNVLHRYIQHLGQLLRNGSAGAADVRRPFHQVDGAVWVHRGGGRCRSGVVAPESAGHAAAPVGTGQGSGVVGMGLGRFQSLHKPNLGHQRAGGPARSFFGAVDQPQVYGVHTQLFGEFVHGRLHGESGGGRTGRAVGRCLGPVDHHVVTFDVGVWNVVGRHHALGAPGNGGTWERSGLENQVCLG